jgi:hypothetical protein
LYRRYQSLE